MKNLKRQNVTSKVQNLLVILCIVLGSQWANSQFGGGPDCMLDVTIQVDPNGRNLDVVEPLFIGSECIASNYGFEQLPPWVTQFSIDSFGGVRFVASANTTGSSRSGNVVLTYEDGEGVTGFGGDIFLIQEVCSEVTWYLDADNDGFHAGTISACASPGPGYTTVLRQAGDCNDADPEINPNTIWYADANGDGFADPGGETRQQCTQPPGSWTLNSDPDPCGVSVSERQALLDLYNSTKGDNWTNTVAGNQPWDISIPVCDWFGVTVASDGRVIQLQLGSNNLTGNVPASITNLIHLTRLRFNSNNLTGSIPLGLAIMTNLNFLDFRFNNLSGTIPSEIGSLVNLQFLHLHGNSLSGNIPSQLGNLINLRGLELNSNQLSGSIPVSLTNLLQLRELKLSQNLLTGTIPGEFGNMNILEQLWLQGNQLTGAIPTALGVSGNLLDDFQASDNQLSGAIPSTLGNLTSLQVLRLRNNQLTGSIPSELGALQNLRDLDLQNNSLSGVIPSEVGNMDALLDFRVSNNQLSGSLPISLTSISGLRGIFVSNNAFSGNVPNFSGLASLANLLLINNNFVFSNFESEHTFYDTNLNIYQFAAQAKVDLEESLSVPENESITLTSVALTSPNNSYQWFKDGVAIPGATAKDYTIASATPADAGVYYFEATNSIVTGLTLTRNDIILTIDAPIDTCGVSEVEKQALLDFYNSTGGDNWTNTLAGNQPWDTNIPVCDWFGVTVVDGNVTVVRLPNNGLVGNLTNTLENLVSLEALELNQNNLSSNIPPSLGTLSNLRILALHINQLSGSVPAELGNLTNLSLLNLNSNNLTGTIPVELGNIGSSLRTLGISSNNLTGTIPIQLSNLTGLDAIFLSNNALSGNIPSELGLLTNLRTLRLFGNNLTGNIPSALGNSSSLQFLLLYDNQLDGAIPVSLGNLSNLRQLLLFDNQLSGTIPDEIGSLSNLNTLQVNQNQLNGAVPSGIVGIPSLINLRFEANLFVFTDFESDYVAYVSKLNSFGFSPQAKVDLEESLSVPENESITLTSVALTSPNNSYQWFKDGVAIPGATAKDYTIASATPADAGVYNFEATNSIVTGLTLTRNDITLTIDAPIDTCGVSEVEKQALLDLYASTGGDNWTNTLAGNQPWDTNIPVCDWFGITVTNETVTAINLPNNNLVGTIPLSIENLAGLRNISLFTNQLSGSIPSTIGNLTQLQILSLSQNQLSGTIPPELGSLSNLLDLLLFDNNLTGTIPPELGNLTSVRDIALAENQLTGTVPIEFGNLPPSLFRLNLSDNQLTGSFPVILASLSSLQVLLISDNQIEGPIPDELYQLTSLRILQLEDNQLSGGISPLIGNLTSLIRFYIQNNELSGAIPVEFSNLAALEDALLFNNNFSGSFPDVSGLINLIRLGLDNNAFSGDFSDLTGLPAFTQLAIPGNAFVFSDFETEHNSYSTNLSFYRFTPQAKVDLEESLSVPENESITLTSVALTSPNNSYQWFKDGVVIPGATAKDYTIASATPADAGVYYFEATNSIVTGLTLTRNDITLTIDAPIDTCGVSEVEKQALLDLYNSTVGDNWTNTVGGDQPWDTNIPVCDWFGVTVVNGEVTELSLIANNLRGPIPASFGNLIHLTKIFLFSNRLDGTIPSELGNLTNLIDLFLDTNQLTGSIPPELGNLVNLDRFRLHANQLTGNIPPELGNLVNATIFSLYRNQLSGSIPITLENLANVTSLRLDDNQLTGSIPSELGSLSTLTELILHTNLLSGDIPVSLGNLGNLRSLRLDDNQLTGTIPSVLENLTNLTSLFLNKNQLEGNVPNELTTLAALRFFFIGDNALQGDLPDFSNFQKSNFSFSNNAYVFSDFEEEHNAYLSVVSNIYEFSPQAKVDLEESLSVPENESITLTSIALTSPNNSYQWFKDGVAIPGATAKDYTIANATSADAGVYYFEATNSIVTGLTLTRNDITLTIDGPIDTCGVSEIEKQALLDLYNSTGGDNWTNTVAGNQPWDTNIPVCDWFGVTVENDMVTRLQLPDNNLVGTISNSIENLGALTLIWLFDNQLSGVIPAEIGNLANLRTLILRQNQLSGTIPPEIGSLSNLTSLILGDNQLTGGIPLEIFQLTTLSDLRLNDNQLTGNIPSEIGQLLNLEIALYLEGNQFSGEIPIELGNLVLLRDLRLSNNQLVGNVPSEISQLTNLETLLLDSNQFSGGIPISLVNFPNLTNRLFFDNNQFVFSDFEQEHPEYLANIGNYRFSPQAKVDIEETLSVLENESITLTSVDLTSPNNSYQWFKDGVAIPGATAKDYSISNATPADAGTYYFEATNSVVVGLTLTRNDITLTVDAPVDTCGVSEVEKQALLDLYNSTDGDNWTNTVAGNQPWDTNIPVCDWFGIIVANEVVTGINLPNNNLVGTIPSSIENLLNLRGLTLTANQLTGTIPASIGNLTQLQTLFLNQNQLTGTIPSELGNLSNLLDLVLSVNNLTGTIPAELGNLTSVRDINLLRNQLTGTVPVTFGNLPASLFRINISENQLTGEIPPAILDLEGLTTLRFDRNGYIFSDFETEFLAYQAKLGTFSFSPQAKVDIEETIAAVAGNTVTLSSQQLISSNNNYQWFKDGVAIPGATNKDLVLTDLSIEEDTGVYYFEATNSVVSGLTLERNTITLNVTGSTTDDTQSFCTSDGIPTVADLVAVIDEGAGIEWFLEQTGGTALELSTPLENGIYWQDLAGGGFIGRVSVLVVIDGDIPTGDAEQFFDFSTNPTVADLVATPSNPNINTVDWFGSASGEDLLPPFIALVPDGVYYAANADGLCRLRVTARAINGEEDCTDALATVVDGSFESALSSTTTGRNGTLGSTDWTVTSGTPDTFAPGNVDPDQYLAHNFSNSPNGGVCAGALREGNTTESFAAQLTNLEIGTVYRVEFYQANATPEPINPLFNEAFGFWEVTLGTETISSNTVAPVSAFPVWERVQIEFTASASETQIQFGAASTTIDASNSYPVYMLIDGIQVYKRPTDIFAPTCSDIDVQVFCDTGGEEPTIADLVSPLSGSTIWYSEQVGGIRYFNDEQLSSFASYFVWADNGSGNGRVAIEVSFDLGTPTGEQFQQFDVASNPTLADIVIEGTNIAWYDSLSSTTPLALSTPLINDTTYFATQEDGICRFAVEVLVGILPPIVDSSQEFCSLDNPTIADLVVTTTNNAYSVIWYTALTDGTALNSTQALQNGSTYYAAQTNGTIISEERSAVRVTVFDESSLSRTYERDIMVAAGSTIGDLSSFFELDSSVLWYDFASGGSAFSSSSLLVNGDTYYARIGMGVCDASEVLAVTVRIEDVENPELITCIKFVPQPGDRYVISGWVREESLIPIPSEVKNFNDEQAAKDAFVALLQYLADRVIEDQMEIPEVFVLKSDQDAPNVDALLPYIKNASSNNVTVYNFTLERETSSDLSRSVGFSFSLDPDNTYRFTYKTPRARYNLVVLGIPIFSTTLESRYPLLNYESLNITFTDVAVNGNNFEIFSDFEVEGEVSALRYSGTNLRSDEASLSGIEGTVQFFDYLEDPEYQVMDYLNTRIEFTYLDINGNELAQAPQNAIFNPKGAVIDGWQRISSDFTIPTDAARMTITLKNDGESLNAYFDDVRMHPFDSNMKSFVYDPITRRLRAELDENNYATFYEYDIEGGLVRVKKETERGVFTIQETRSGNSKLLNR